MEHGDAVVASVVGFVREDDHTFRLWKRSLGVSEHKLSVLKSTSSFALALAAGSKYGFFDSNDCSSGEATKAPVIGLVAPTTSA